MAKKRKMTLDEALDLIEFWKQEFETANLRWTTLREAVFSAYWEGHAFTHPDWRILRRAFEKADTALTKMYRAASDAWKLESPKCCCKKET